MEKQKDLIEMNDLKKPNYFLMSIQRILVLSLVIASVVVIVYYTPMPEEYFENCDRACHELDWPMICRVKLVIENYKTLSKSCEGCTDKGGICPSTCVSGDGRERGILSINRKLPAPPIHVCQNDILVVDVVHRAPAHALTLHWRGQPQKETPFMDGAPMLTQCPQPAYTTFQYKFRASAAGTHMYHAHSAAEAADGLAGAFVVRQPSRTDPLKELYDYDLTEHTIFVAEWGHSMGPLAGMIAQTTRAESLLINGRGQTPESPNAPLSTFFVKAGKRYRFRLAFGGGSKSCPMTFSIENHSLSLVALDGHRIEPENVDTITLNKGERADFILNASRTGSAYKIKAVSESSCQDNLFGFADLIYENEDAKVIVKSEDVEESKTQRAFTSVYSEQCKNDEVLCIDEVRSIDILSEDLSGSVENTLYVPYNFTTGIISAKRRESWGQSDGYRFTYPASPLLTQPDDVSPSAVCSEDQEGNDECVHVKPIPLYSTVEVIMFDQGGESDHIFHLHGYSFYVVGIREFNKSLDKNTIMSLNDEDKLFIKRNLVNPVLKDTTVIPKFGVVALRFKADNPGYWLMRDERSSHWTRGLDFVLKVGRDKDFVSPPSDFPKCGSFVGPEFFLI